MTKAQKRLTEARHRLRRTMDRACIARGEAQWTNGYRAARLSCGAESEVEDQRLYDKEMLQFKQCAIAERTMERAMRAYALEIRRSQQPQRRRGSTSRR